MPCTGHPPTDPPAADHTPIPAPSLTCRMVQSPRGRASLDRPAWAATPRQSCTSPCMNQGGPGREVQRRRLARRRSRHRPGRLLQQESAPARRTAAFPRRSKRDQDWGGGVERPLERSHHAAPTHSGSGVTAGGLGQLCAGAAVSAAAAATARATSRSVLMVRSVRGAGSETVRDTALVGLGQSSESRGLVGRVG